jgi:hypothetical protein
MLKPEDNNWLDVKLPGILGWNIFKDSSAIEDNELADAQNVVYDNGFLSPRQGKILVLAKPSGETAYPLQIMSAKTSDGVKYKIAIYGNSFYLLHPDNLEWIKINQTYTPAETTLRYGNVVWNNGRGDDRLYFCNGVDNFGRWDICVTRASGVQASGGATLTVDDNTRFPATGTLVIKGDNGVFTEAYTAKVGTTGFTLTNTLSDNVSDNASVTMDVVEKSGMEIGKIVGKNQSRLYVMNYYGGEVTGWYSVQSEPENFTTGSTVPAASTFVISDGNGEITGFHDFGQFAVIEKEDSLHSIEQKIADDLGSKLDVIKPIVSGESVGTISMASTVKVQNTLVYPTRNNGFISLSPTGTGDSLSVEKNTISTKIQKYVTEKINNDGCVGVAVDQKIIWTTAKAGATQNTIILVYDLQREAWSRWNNISAKDLLVEDDELFYIDSGNGGLYQLLTGTYDDENNHYEVIATMKRFDFGKMSKPKTQDLVYLQGYMTPSTDLYVDIYFNEDAILGKQTFRLNKDTDGILFSAPLTNAAGEFIAGQPTAGWVITSEIGDLSFFRCYLSVNAKKGFYNLQPVFRQNKQAFFGITGIGFNPSEISAIPIGMTVSPISSE